MGGRRVTAVRFSDELLNRLNATAKQRMVSRNMLVEEAVRRLLDELDGVEMEDKTVRSGARVPGVEIPEDEEPPF